MQASPDPRIDADRGLSSDQLFNKYAVTVCTQCNAWIASDRRYGRAPSKDDPNLCECCEVMTPEQAERLANL